MAPTKVSGRERATVTPVVMLLVRQVERTPLPTAPPLDGPGWTVVVPALLFLVAAISTWALWRHFADKD